MNDPGDLTVTHSGGTPDPKNCSLVSIIPIVGMSSCRGRAEAFARRLSSKLRTLGTQGDDDADLSHEDEDEPIINGGNTNTWVTGVNRDEQTVTDLQPLRHESDSFFDFDCDLESPGSPADECEYLRLIESTSNTPHNSAAESGYACASVASSHSSSDGHCFDANAGNGACTSHAQQTLQLPHHHQNTQPHPHPHLHPHPESHENQQQTSTYTTLQTQSAPANDEVDSTSPNAVTIQSNGFQNFTDLTQTLPSEGPDIEPPKIHTEDDELDNANQIDMTQNIQEEILKELHQQSIEYKVEEKEDNNKMNCTEEGTIMETTIENFTVPEAAQDEVQQETLKVAEVVNGLAENGENVLKMEELNGKELEVKTENDSNIKVAEVAENSLKNDDTNKIEAKEQTKSSHLHMEATDDDDDCRPQRVRRCSSLKTGKTPPGTPSRKKIVRFADVLGLDLADIKTFLDEIPNIPKSAYEDLEILESEPPVQLGPKSDKLLMPLFQQPGGLANFLDIVREKLVSLENAAVTDAINQTITGSVRVRNLDFHKSVHIRYSLDGWRSFADLQANYVQNSCDGFSDKFTFFLFGNSLHIGQRLEFAVRFQCKGHQYWDNNYGANYCFQCLPSSAPTIATILPTHHSNNMLALLSPTVGESWCTSFY